MNLPGIILFAYTSLVSFFLAASFGTKAFNSGNWLPIVFILPLPVYFAYYLLKAVIRSRHSNFSGLGLPGAFISKRQFQTSLFALAILIGLGAWQALTAPSTQQAQTTVATPSPQPSPSPTIAPMITVRLESPNAIAGIRSQPSTQSAIIDQAQSGSTYPLITNQDGWYQVSLPDGSTGWINQALIELQLTPHP